MDTELQVFDDFDCQHVAPLDFSDAARYGLERNSKVVAAGSSEAYKGMGGDKDSMMTGLQFKAKLDFRMLLRK